MSLVSTLKRLFPSESIPEQLGLTDAEFFKRLLSALPDHARIEFDRAEPESWVESLRPWSRRENPGQYEADYYLMEPKFITALSDLVESAPQELESCHHMSAIDSSGVRLFSSLDNFCVMGYREDVAQALAEINEDG